MPDLHHVTYRTGTNDVAGGVFDWVAECTCGERSDRPDPADGTMASARQWAGAHRAEHPHPAHLGGPPQVLLTGKALDAPDHAPDSYDTFLRSLTRKDTP